MSAPSDQHVEQLESASLAIVPVEGEPRIRDLDLAARLGFDRPRKIRDLIKRYHASLLRMGPCPTLGRVINGGQAIEYYLNRKQAIFITAKSETPAATEITIEIVQRFDAYERGAASLVNLNDPSTLRHALIAYTERTEKAEAALAIAAPKARAYEEFIRSDGELTIDAAAKMLLRWSGQRLYRRLQEAGWVDRRNGINTPRLWVIQQGFMVVRPTALPNGRIYCQPMLTPKGVAALRLAIRDGDLFLTGIDAARLLPAPSQPHPN